MTTNSIFFDKKSRYNNLDNNNIVFLTPRQVIDLDIGFTESKWKPDELDTEYPFLVDTLKEMIKETTLGETNGSEIQLSVHDSMAKVFICVEINSKLCKLQMEEWDLFNGLSGIPVETQTKVFQRLISEGQVTLEDLAVEDINNDVFKKLVANDIAGGEICARKSNQIDKWVKEQSKDNHYIKLKRLIIENNK